MALFFPKGEVLMPYDVSILERTVAACGGVMQPGCKFKCTMYSTETPGKWSLPCVFKARYVSLDEGIRIKFRVYPGALVWLLLLLPLAVAIAMLWLELSVEISGLFGALVGVVAFAFTYQRGKAIPRFLKRFGK